MNREQVEQIHDALTMRFGQSWARNFPKHAVVDYWTRRMSAYTPEQARKAIESWCSEHPERGPNLAQLEDKLAAAKNDGRINPQGPEPGTPQWFQERERNRAAFSKQLQKAKSKIGAARRQPTAAMCKAVLKANAEGNLELVKRFNAWCAGEEVSFP